MMVTESGPAVRHSKNQYEREREREREMLVEEKGAFNQNAGNLGRW